MVFTKNATRISNQKYILDVYIAYLNLCFYTSKKICLDDKTLAVLAAYNAFPCNNNNQVYLCLCVY